MKMKVYIMIFMLKIARGSLRDTESRINEGRT